MTAPEPRYPNPGDAPISIVGKQIPGRLGLADLYAYLEHASRHLPEPARGQLTAALRRVWLRNRLPAWIPSTAVADIADHCDLATIAALATLDTRCGPRVDPQPRVRRESLRCIGPGRSGPGREG